jgi:hypothetical protein
MNAVILDSPEKNTNSYSEAKTKKPTLVKGTTSPVSNNVNLVAETETQTYTFVGIAG